jgi:hypothetical protein
MSFPTLAATFAALPTCGELFRQYAEHPPSGSLRFAPAEYEALSDAEQEAITAVVFQALVRWRAFLRSLPGRPEGATELSGEGTPYASGAAAFEVLVGFDALMSDAEVSTSIAKVDSFIDLCMAEVLANQGKADVRRVADAAGHQFVVAAGPDLESLAKAAWVYQQLVDSDQRYVVLDLAAGLDSQARNPMGETLKRWAGALATSSFPDRYRLLHRAVVVAAAELHEWRPPYIEAGPVSLAPTTDPIWRRCTRVLAMVHELHKAGYQRLRIRPFFSGSGCYWRCWITPASNMRPDGYNLIEEDHDDANPGLVARYTSGQDNEFFGWTDAKSMTARELAATFTKRFPRIVEQSQGCDWAYAGWLTDVLGHAERGLEHGGLVNLDNYDGPMDPGYLARWQPPPPFNQA